MHDYLKFDESEQCVLSYELVQLLRWLIEHEQTSLRTLVTKALKKDFVKSIKEADSQTGSSKAPSPGEVRAIIIEFLHCVDLLLIDAIVIDKTSQQEQKRLLPAISQIDQTAYEQGSIRTSIEKAHRKISQQTSEAEAQEKLFKELLRSWKPVKQRQASN
jgi:hypothetical protein